MTGHVRPRALLLDFGGVVFQTTHRPGWERDMAREIGEMLTRAGCADLAPEMIRVDIESGRAAASAWKNSMSRPYAPRELTQVEFWRDFVAADWPSGARELVITEAGPLSRRMGELCDDRAPRDGIKDLLEAAVGSAVRIGIVSNALMGGVHRTAMREHGLEHYVALQVYSDEVGVRKPNPEMINIAARAMCLDAGECWYVGDNFDRDVVCGRRAGVAMTILMVDKATYQIPYRVRQEPDAIVDDPHGLLDLFSSAPAA